MAVKKKRYQGYGSILFFKHDIVNFCFDRHSKQHPVVVATSRWPAATKVRLIADDVEIAARYVTRLNSSLNGFSQNVLTAESLVSYSHQVRVSSFA